MDLFLGPCRVLGFGLGGRVLVGILEMCQCFLVLRGSAVHVGFPGLACLARGFMGFRFTVHEA